VLLENNSNAAPLSGKWLPRAISGPNVVGVVLAFWMRAVQ
jgi:hypothetical protein